MQTKRTHSGRPSVLDTHPALAAQWASTNTKKVTQVSSGSAYRADWYCKEHDYSWSATVNNRTRQYKGYCCPVGANRVVKAGYNNLPTTHPAPAAQRASTNTKKVTQVSSGSAYRADWYCKEHDYSWYANVCDRTKQKSCCPVGSGQATKAGYNDLPTTHPALAAQWAPTNTKKVTQVSSGSNHRADWYCKEHDYSWSATVGNRTQPDSSYCCPVGSGSVVKVGYNDLPTTHPSLASQWAPTNTKKVTQVSKGSNHRADWYCKEHDYSWSTVVASRTKQDSSYCCPVGSGQAVKAGCNDLPTTHPPLAAQWAPTNTKKVTQVSSGSGHRADWYCKEHDYSWSATVNSRTHKDLYDYCCPVGSVRVVKAGYNDLLTTHPHLVAQWAPTNTKKVTQVSRGSDYRADWYCKEHDYSWSVAVSRRTQSNSCCPVGANRVAKAGYNDLPTTRPDLAAQWAPTNTKKVTQVSSGSNHRVDWYCKEHDYSWSAIPAARSLVLDVTRPGCCCPMGTRKWVTALRRYQEFLADPDTTTSPEVDFRTFAPEQEAT